MRSAMAKACDISAKVKKEVWERDEHLCVVCGRNYDVMPNAHYIRRSQGGLGIPQNVVTLCQECHRKFDFEHDEAIKDKIVDYLISCYPDWEESRLYYKKWDF